MSQNVSSGAGAPQKGNLLLIGSGILVVLGIVFWIVQVTTGAYTYDTQYPWGPLVAAFFAATACGIGTMLVGGVLVCLDLADSSLRSKLYRAAFGCLAMASIIIIADLGNPLTFFDLIATTNFLTPMVFDFWFMLASLIICLLGTFMKGNAKLIACLGFVTACGLMGSESWVLTSGNSLELWITTMSTCASFLQIVIAGLAVIAIVDAKAVDWIRKALCIALAAYFVVAIIDLLVGIADGGDLGQTWSMLSVSPAFIIGIIVGIVVPFVMALRGGLSRVLVLVVSLASVIGIFLFKLAYIWTAESVSLQSFLPPGELAVGLCEVGIVICFAFIGVFAYELIGKIKGGDQA